MDRVARLASQRAVVIFSTSSCCMCHTIKAFFQDLGVNYAAYELDEDPQGRHMEKALAKLLGRSPPVPAVFIGGKLVGSTDRVMSLHLSGKLTTMLREAGAKLRPVFGLASGSEPYARVRIFSAPPPGPAGGGGAESVFLAIFHIVVIPTAPVNQPRVGDYRTGFLDYRSARVSSDLASGAV
ncbi:hypothetical protein Taro_003840 [Colocasia esculenta]|uniref:Glutaredoxin domain-containing protein n=1 Tax=Colocasia esculenta TaxID=4460 RepID=A0A843TQ18_COLES|nr:hypothetical protein [Colocasia esculenta]